jgi:hypothetical protein
MRQWAMSRQGGPKWRLQVGHHPALPSSATSRYLPQMFARGFRIDQEGSVNDLHVWDNAYSVSSWSCGNVTEPVT